MSFWMTLSDLAKYSVTWILLWQLSLLWIFVVKGCMNNVTFGDENVGYYETVAGGAGAVSTLPRVLLPDF